MLYERGSISTEQAQRMMCFSVCPGPAFMITAVGAVLLGNVRAGLILYLAQIISCLLTGSVLGIFSRRGIRHSNVRQSAESEKKGEKVSPLGNLLSSVDDAATSIIGMTALILVFSMIENVIAGSGLYDGFSSVMSFMGMDRRLSGMIIPSLLEVTGGCSSVKEASLPLWCFALCTGFGGMCVHLQIFGILRNVPLDKGRYLLFRVISGGLSAGAAYIISRITSYTEPVFSVGGGDNAYFSSATAAGSAALVIMSVIFVLTMHRGAKSL